MKRLEHAQARLGGYSLLRPLAESKTSTDYLATIGGDVSRYCVVKIITPQTAAPAAFEEYLQNAVDIARRVEHPQLIRVLECGQQDGQHFIATEYVPGTTLRAIHARLVDEGQRLPVPCAVSVGLLLITALHRLAMADEGRGPLVHGNIRMDRVRVGISGVVKLDDFCVEHASRKALGEAVRRPEYEQQRAEIGYGHLCVEQLMHEPLSAQVDQYGVAAIMYELLAGRPPFERHDVATTIAAVLGGTLVDLRRQASQVPEPLNKVIFRALERRPEDRYASPAAMYSALESVANGFDMTSAVGL
ncbi:MAG: protein kinase, partial [Myxococcota bacterium]